MISTSKHNRLYENLSQYFYKKNPNPTLQIQENIEQYVRSCPISDQKTLQFIIRSYLTHNSDIIFPSQREIARYTGFHYNTINRSIDRLVKDGFLEKRRQFNTSCVYKISSFLTNPFTISRLSHILPYIRIFCISSLCSWIIATNRTGDLMFNKQGLLGNVIINSSVGRRDIGEQKESSSMQAISQKIYGEKNPISPLIQQLNSRHGFNLSLYAQIKFTSFPDEALEYVIRNIKYTRTIRDPYNWAYKMCLDYCYANQLSPDWFYTANLMAAQNLKPDSPIYDVQRPSGNIQVSAPADRTSYAKAPKVPQGNGGFIKKQYNKQGPSVYKPTLPSIKEEEDPVQKYNDHPLKPYIPDPRRRHAPSKVEGKPMTESARQWLEMFPYPWASNPPDSGVE